LICSNPVWLLDLGEPEQLAEELAGRGLTTGWSGNLYVIDADDAHQTVTLYQRVSVLLSQTVVGAYVEGSFTLLAIAAHPVSPHQSPRHCRDQNPSSYRTIGRQAHKPQ
jgi:hypothetical protein